MLTLTSFFVLGALAASYVGAHTVLSCAYPTSFVPFGVFCLNLTISDGRMTHQNESDAKQLTPPEGLNFNGVWHPQFGLAYSSDVSGAIAIHIPSISAAPVLNHSASLNDHARWYRDLVAFSSTRMPPRPQVSQQGWNAVYVANVSDSMHTPIRLTPANETDYSPAWSPCGRFIAVATGSGEAGKSNLTMMQVSHHPLRLHSRKQVAINGGWPSFWRNATNGHLTVFFHRLQRGNSITGQWSLFALDLDESRSEPAAVLVKEGLLTPFVDGNDLVYAFLDENGHRQIGWMNLLTMETRAVTNDPTHHYNPSLSTVRNGTEAPARKLLLFHKCRGGTLPNVRRRISPEPAVTDLAYTVGDFPSMSPDGARIAVIGTKTAQFAGISIFESNGFNRTFIFDRKAWMISWRKISASGEEMIAFTSGPAFAMAWENATQVALIRPNGSGFREITRGRNANQGYPCFSPDGSRVVYRTSINASDTPNVNDVYPGAYHLAIQSIENGEAITLTPPIAAHNGTTQYIGDQHPHWADDGETIVFASDRGHPQRLSIWTVNVNGSDLREIFDQGAMSVHPSSFLMRNHNGNKTKLRIVFTSTYAGYSMEEISWPFGFVFQAEVFTMDRDGGNIIRLTHDAGENANVFAGRHRLPSHLVNDGWELDCVYHDSTQPKNPYAVKNLQTALEEHTGSDDDYGRFFPHGHMKRKGGRSKCPLAKLLGQ